MPLLILANSELSQTTTGIENFNSKLKLIPICSVHTYRVYQPFSLFDNFVISSRKSLCSGLRIILCLSHIFFFCLERQCETSTAVYLGYVCFSDDLNQFYWTQEPNGFSHPKRRQNHCSLDLLYNVQPPIFQLAVLCCFYVCTSRRTKPGHYTVESIFFCTLFYIYFDFPTMKTVFTHLYQLGPILYLMALTQTFGLVPQRHSLQDGFYRIALERHAQSLDSFYKSYCLPAFLFDAIEWQETVGEL